ncbi:acetate--CoA ligase [Halobacteriovorax sp. GFR7]|uniref:acetate--CoA ligase n=1 Tax=unclassified Halobacteriovorax TaxID=2639665 RepID=UPI003D95E348
METEVLKKGPPYKKEPNLIDYYQVYENFDWQEASKSLSGLPDNKGLNIAYEAIDRHCERAETGNKVAVKFIRKQGTIQNFSFFDLKKTTNQFANVLKELGVAKGERVFCLAPRVPELYLATFGILKNRSVFCPLFSAFGPEPIMQRMTRGDASVLITTESLYKMKIQKIRDQIPSLKHVILIPDKNKKYQFENIHWWDELMAKASEEYLIAETSPEDMALMHFTSGTTGKPKGAIHVHQAVIVHYLTGKYALDIHEDDIFWCTADPGWVTGTSYGIISPLVIGATNIVVESEFDAHQWMQILKEQNINIWYTAPTAIRMLMKSEISSELPIELEHLRFIASVGEPLNPEAVRWGVKAFNMPIHDNWWQSETGGIMISNFISMDIKAGSMGRPLPGIEATIVEVTEEGEQKKIKEITEPNKEGMLALKKGWPSMFRGYLHQNEKYENSFCGEYYLTGDLAKKDKDGHFWFIGRADDVIKTAGHLIGPFEVESTFMEHPAVAEAAVIGKPDEIAGNIIKAFVVLKKDFVLSEQLENEILGFVRKKLGAAVAPKEIDYISDLPKTRSGKIMRRLLKARELGLPEGDISTLLTQEGSS